MQLEDYFHILTPNDIRINGSRIGIESILYEYIYRYRTPEQITKTYPTLTLEQVYATILFYLSDREKISQYMSEWLTHCTKSEQAQDENPPEFILKLRKLRAERQSTLKRNNEYSVSS
ncbi:DUF433 domain-containing protein [Roseofilum casamattae]|uniref:DUF433 domain-containing protein n=1 Tax=Roseofilum casamattae BLCC-M143 TaxID=3022442 RepID=A0ABT7C2K6_9CYAN|nr:DUF433 domain-containing protein [Roseofilum casamattae]MDJ1184969.1 DUF433 domain-containing protein [Roseofilum casamattae BLCC-M143]